MSPDGSQGPAQLSGSLRPVPGKPEPPGGPPPGGSGHARLLCHCLDDPLCKGGLPSSPVSAHLGVPPQEAPEPTRGVHLLRAPAAHAARPAHLPSSAHGHIRMRAEAAPISLLCAPGPGPPGVRKARGMNERAVCHSTSGGGGPGRLSGDAFVLGNTCFRAEEPRTRGHYQAGWWPTSQHEGISHTFTGG